MYSMFDCLSFNHTSYSLASPNHRFRFTFFSKRILVNFDKYLIINILLSTVKTYRAKLLLHTFTSTKSFLTGSHSIKITRRVKLYHKNFNILVNISHHF